MKTNHNFREILLSVCLLSFFSYCTGQTISGNVLDSKTGDPIQGAELTIRDAHGSSTFTTGSSGFYMFEMAPGSYVIVGRHSDYNTWASGEIKLENMELRFLDIKMTPVSSLPPPEVKEAEEVTEPAPQAVIEKPMPAPQASIETGQPLETGQLIRNPSVALGIGYQFGEIGGITGNADLSLSKIFNWQGDASNFFITAKLGNQKASYSSEMFNDINREYEFSFTRWMVGMYKIFDAGSLLITPELTYGAERATPVSDNVHDMIDNGSLRVAFVTPSLSLGIVITPNLVANITGSWHLMMKETRNQDSKILGFTDALNNSWNPWSYPKDFFQKREKESLSISIKYFLY
jgi:hypothetical protein